MALAHAILATLCDRPRSGYDLAKQFDGSVGFFWKATHQQIYRELTRMEEQSWLVSEVVLQEGRPNKKLYSVTDLGKQHLQDWIRQPVDINPVRDDMLVKIFAGYLVEPDDLLTELIAHQRQHEAQLAVYLEIEQRFFAQPQTVPRPYAFQYLTLRYGIQHERTWLAWCAETLVQIQELSP